MESIVIVAYQPLKGKENRLKELLLKHWHTLNNEGLVSPRKPVIAIAENGTYVEIFGWRSNEAKKEAHSNRKILMLWDEFTAVCDMIPIGEVDEAHQLFSAFKPVN